MQCEAAKEAQNTAYRIGFETCNKQAEADLGICHAGRNAQNELYRAEYNGCKVDADRRLAACNAEKELQNAASAVCKQIKTDFSNIEREFRAGLKLITSIGEQIDKTQRQIIDVGEFIRNVEAEVKRVPTALKEASKPFEEAGAQLRRLANQELVLYDITTDLALTYNARTGATWFKVGLPGGISLNYDKIRAALEGNLVLPDIDPIAFVNQIGFIKAHKYDRYHNWRVQRLSESGQNKHIYVSSKRFTDGISLEAITDDIIAGIFSGGATTSGSLSSIKELFVLEWADLTSWLKGVGEAEAEKVAVVILKEIFARLTGQDGAGDGALPQITFKSGDIKYSYRAGLENASRRSEGTSSSRRKDIEEYCVDAC